MASITFGDYVSGSDGDEPTTAQIQDALDEALADCVRRASTRAEHMRLTRIQGFLVQLRDSIRSDELGRDHPS